LRSTTPPTHHLVLAGGGHSHALVLRTWAMARARGNSRSGPPAHALITLVSRSSSALYSGMVPGLIAGLYAREACSIDLRRLCAQAGVSFVCAEITGLDLTRQELQLAGRPPLRWDRLSLDVGAVSAPAPARCGGDGRGDGCGRDIAIKPLEPFLGWCDAQDSSSAALAVLGGGAAGLEVALALRRRFGPGRSLAIEPRPTGLQLGSAAANRCGERLLAAAGIRIGAAEPETQRVLCTGSRAPAWLAAAGLATDPASGRVWTESSLQVEGQTAIFASGDCGLIRTAPRPPSGVWAVRAAPVLATNLRRSLSPAGTPLRRWRPQRQALRLLGAGPGNTAGHKAAQPRAVAFWGPLAVGPSRWLWRWKAHLDQRFMDGFEDVAAMGQAGQSAIAMPCRGCAAKLPAAPLSRALARLAGLAGGQSGGIATAQTAEDAVIIAAAADGSRLLQSLDGFPALVDDPWLNGRLTTLHACSDLWACGGRVESAQALVTLPRAADSLQEDLLLQTLAGVRSVLDDLGAELLGGHTLQQLQAGEGLSLALCVNGSTPACRFWAKGGLRAGDALILTRPIGTGVLFAAAMAGGAGASWIDQALTVMQQSQAVLVEQLAAHGCTACTDITGFGLLGHLGEMLAAGELTVELDGEAIAVLPGVWALLADGFSSSLAPSNRQALGWLECGLVRFRPPAQQPELLKELLIDPQTCGPLLAALPAERAAAALGELRASGFEQAAVIGRVLAR